ncbi:MAG: hypothetical protein ACRDRZ_03705 [Pseudonocardiaceae bacterium]
MTPNTTNALLQIARQRRALASLRMHHANLLAAARATLTAARDGDTHPLAYLIDELTAQGQLPPTETGSPIPGTDGLSAWFHPASESAGDGDQR